MSETVQIELMPQGTRVEVARGSAIADVLAAYGVEFPCGGSDLCGGCRVRVIAGTLLARIEDKCVFSEQELAQGWRLACRAHAETPLKLEVGQWTTPVLADSTRLEGGGRTGLGIAIDLGTTTIVAQILDLASGEVLAVATGLNPQCAHGADVMSRVLFSLSDPGLTPLIRQAIGGMVAEIVLDRGAEVREVVLVGNTVMHHLFAGIDVEPLSHAPFVPKDAGEQHFAPEQLGWALPPSCRVRFLPCLGGFVGSDILAGIVAVDLPAGDRLRVLIDLGTNGEIVLGNRSRMLCASTAAGPAFEAGSIRMGMRAASGAISHVFVREDALECHVIGNAPPRGVCGSGLVDAVAAGLDLGAILPGGGLANGAREFPVAGPVVLAQTDIRELQLAKAALASGLRLLLRRWGATHDDIEVVHLAGAFGNYVRIESAVRIGLLETAPCRINAAGNTALRGAKMMLLSPTPRPPVHVEHIPLASEPRFQDEFIACLQFPSV
ncbi:MAG: ASKHA domain-containing protein [Acidobacteriia bacterium]|nr:ASKHA domain-containing protein [Terriglobia bacterium]